MSGKYRKRNQQKTLFLLSVLAIILLVACIVVYLKYYQNDNPKDIVSETTDYTITEPTDTLPETLPSTASTGATEDRPQLLFDGKVVIESVFQYTGPNPDALWQEGNNIGAVIVQNVSEEYLDEATLQIGLSDGIVLNFLISDIPAGKKVWAFDINNSTITSDTIMAYADGEASFVADEVSIPGENVTISVDAQNVTITNVSDTDLHDITVSCKMVLDDAYFAGKSFEYSLDSISSGSSGFVTAFDCLVGNTEVTRIKVSNP